MRFPGKILTVALVLVGLLNMNLIAWINYRIEHAKLKSEFQDILHAGVDESCVTVFVFSAQEWKKLKLYDEDEIRILGETYDIISEETTGRMIRIRCIQDSTEKLLEEKAEAMAGNSVPRDQKDNDEFKIKFFGTQKFSVLSSFATWIFTFCFFQFPCVLSVCLDSYFQPPDCI